MIKRTYPNQDCEERAKGYLRDLVAENHLSADDFIHQFSLQINQKQVDMSSIPEYLGTT